MAESRSRSRSRSPRSASPNQSPGRKSRSLTPKSKSRSVSPSSKLDVDKDNQGKIYIGNLPYEIKEEDLKGEFDKYGPIENILLKKEYAFIEYKNSEDASKAVKDLENSKIFGREAKVEHAKGPSRTSRLPNSVYRVFVDNLDSSVTWQELKDHMKKAGSVFFSDISRDDKGDSKGKGIVEYGHVKDMRRAIEKLDGTSIHNKSIKVREAPNNRTPRRRRNSPRRRRRYSPRRRDYSPRRYSPYRSNYRRRRSYSPRPRRRHRSYSRSRSPPRDDRRYRREDRGYDRREYRGYDRRDRGYDKRDSRGYNKKDDKGYDKDVVDRKERRSPKENPKQD